MAPRPAISALISDESVLLFPIGWFAKEQFHFFISHQWPRDIICGVDGYELGWPRSAFILYSSGDLAAIWKQCYCAYNLFADVFFWNPLWFQQSWEKPIYRQVSTMKSIRKFAKRPIPLPSPNSIWTVYDPPYKANIFRFGPQNLRFHTPFFFSAWIYIRLTEGQDVVWLTAPFDIVFRQLCPKPTFVFFWNISTSRTRRNKQKEQ